MPRGTTLRNFRCDDERWKEFLAACAEQGTDASRQIRDMIDEWLSEGLAGLRLPEYRDKD